MHSFLFKWRLKLASNGLEFENDAALVNSIKSNPQFHQILEVIVQKENISETDQQKSIQKRFEKAKKSESYLDRIISMAFLIQAAWENDSSFDWKEHCKETSKLELEKRFGRRQRNRVQQVLNIENVEVGIEEEFNDENDSGFDDVSNFEYFVQRRSPAITAPANQSSLNPQRLLENLEKFVRVKDKIMRRRELNY